MHESTRNDNNIWLSIKTETDGGVSAKVEIVRDGVTYSVVDGTKEAVEGAICVWANMGSYYAYYADYEDWLSDSGGKLSLYIYLKENQIINFNMDGIENADLEISLPNSYVKTTMPSNGIYSYYALEEGYYGFFIDNGISFRGDITVSDIGRGQAVAGQTTDTLTAYEEGEMYSCLVTCGEEKVWSDFITGTLMIKTQPTAANPTVELNYDVDAAYQWYNVENQMYTVVDNDDELADDEKDINDIYWGAYSEGKWYSEEDGDAIEGETKATLQNYEYGKTYVCKVATEDGVEVMSDFVDIDVAVSSQPTAANPVVEVNFSDMVSKYQWYEMDIHKYEVADESKVSSENASEVIGVQTGLGVYEDGMWTSADNEEGYYAIYILAEVKKGDLIKVTPAIGDNILFAGYERGGSDDDDGNYFECEDGVYYYEFTSSAEVVIAVVASEEFTAEITIENIVRGNAVEGQTTKKLTNHEAGTYICELTLTDGRVLLSDKVSITEADITHTYTDEYDADCNDCGAVREILERETEPSDEEKEISPDTGDGANVSLIIGLAFAGLAGALAVSVSDKKRYQ